MMAQALNEYHGKAQAPNVHRDMMAQVWSEYLDKAQVQNVHRDIIVHVRSASHHRALILQDGQSTIWTFHLIPFSQFVSQWSQAVSWEFQAASWAPRPVSLEFQAASFEFQAASFEPLATSWAPRAASWEFQAAFLEPLATSWAPQVVSWGPQAISQEPRVIFQELFTSEDQGLFLSVARSFVSLLKVASKSLSLVLKTSFRAAFSRVVLQVLAFLMACLFSFQ